MTRLGERPTDREIWDYGRERGCIVVTRDTDVFDRLVLEGPPPKVVWVRLGNVRRRVLVEKWRAIWPEIERMLLECDWVEAGPEGVEGLRFDRGGS